MKKRIIEKMMKYEKGGNFSMKLDSLIVFLERSAMANHLGFLPQVVLGKMVVDSSKKPPATSSSRKNRWLQ